ncbi:MAG: hypothetical protein JWN51_1604 [Phycisphaerales bacterium]|nr:hypothetical protein [Phycisphaerales bacterium]
MRPFAPFIALGIALFSPAPIAIAADPAPSDNAATYYRQAFDALPKGDDVDRVFKDWDNVAFDGPTIKILRQCDPAIELMQRGASMKKCDWELDYNKGMELELPELKQARRLAEATSLKTRYLCEVKRYERVAAISADLITMGRHLSMQQLFVSRLIGIGVETEGIHVAARYLPDLPPPVLQQLADRLGKLPDAAALADTLRNEGRMSAITIKKGPAALFGVPLSDLPKDPAARAELATQVEAAWDQAAKVVSVPLNELPGTHAQLQAIQNAAPLGAATFVKPLPALPPVDCMIAADRALLRAAVAVTQKGPGAAKSFPDPFGSAPFTCEAIDGGYELRSVLLNRKAKPESLKTGPHAYDD